MYYGVSTNRNYGGKMTDKGVRHEGLVFWGKGGSSEEEKLIVSVSLMLSKSVDETAAGS